MIRHRMLAACLAFAFGLSGCIGSDQEPSSPNTPGSFASLVTPGTPRWRALAEAPSARQEVAAALLDGKVYVVGGLTGSGATTRVDVYDMSADSWAEGPGLPVAVHHAMAAAYRSHVWVIGGFDAAGKPVDTTFVLFGDRWVAGPRLRAHRAAGVAIVVADETLFVVGGQGADGLVAETEVYHATGTGDAVVQSSWQGRAHIPTPRHHLGVASDGTWLYATGGRRPAAGGGPDQNVAAFERFNVAENRWVQAPPMPAPRSGHASGFIDGRVVVTGGEDPAIGSGQPPIATTHDYDPDEGVWRTALPGMFRPRHGVGTLTFDDKLYVFLGGSRVAVAPTADSDVLIIP